MYLLLRGYLVNKISWFRRFLSVLQTGCVINIMLFKVALMKISVDREFSFY